MKKVVFWIVVTILSLFGVYYTDYKIGAFLGTKIGEALREMGGDE